MKVGIVFPVLNQFRMAIEAIESVQTQYDWQPFIVAQYQERKSLSAAWNEGIHQAIDARCNYILVSNDDVLFSPWTIDGLVEAFENSPGEIVMITAINQRGNIDPPEGIKNIPKPEIVTTAESPDFSGFMIRNSFLEVVGEFDTNIFPSYHEDNEMHIRVKALGYKAITITSAPFYHYGSRTQNAELAAGNPVCSGQEFDQNGAYVRAKWGTNDAAHMNYLYPFNDPANDPRIIKKEWRPMLETDNAAPALQ